MMKRLFCLILLLHCFLAVPSLFDDGILYANTYYSVEPGNPQEPSDIKKWLALAEQGNAGAQFNLGLCYYNGEGVVQSYAEAVKWYLKSARKGYAPSQAQLVFAYYYGHGCEPNYKEAMKWAEKLKGKGEGIMLSGLGVEFWHRS